MTSKNLCNTCGRFNCKVREDGTKAIIDECSKYLYCKGLAEEEIMSKSKEIQTRLCITLNDDRMFS